MNAYKVTIREPLSTPDRTDWTILVTASTFEEAEQEARTKLSERFGDQVFNAEEWRFMGARDLGKF